jgi:hypothetical protein
VRRWLGGLGYKSDWRARQLSSVISSAKESGIMYEYKTIIQDVVPDPSVQAKLDADLNLICQQGMWEVFTVTAVSFSDDNFPAVQKVYTLRREVWQKISFYLREVKDLKETDKAKIEFYDKMDVFYETMRKKD